jgi:hypothetical protein
VRRRLTWLVALPTILAGSQAAHALAYRMVFPESTLRLHALALSGHGYLAWLPLVLAVGAALAAVGLVSATLDTARGRTVGSLPPLAFAVLPPLAFAVQELLELSLRSGHLDWRAFAAPTFLPGLALQLPFGLLAYAAARLLLRAAVAVGRLLQPLPRPRAATRYRHFCNRIAALLQSDCSRSRAPPFAVGI